MKNTTIKIILLVFFVLWQTSFGREKPKAYLVNESGNLPCDPFLADINGFLQEIRNNPGSTGYAIIYDREDGRKFRFYERLIVDLNSAVRSASLSSCITIGILIDKVGGGIEGKFQIISSFLFSSNLLITGVNALLKSC